MARLIQILAGSFLGISCIAQAAGNDDIVAMARAGVGDEAIIAQVAASSCTYKVETVDLVQLRKAGVSSRVTAAMIRACARKEVPAVDPSDPARDLGLRPGLYAVESGIGGTRYSLIVPAIVAAGQAGGNGSLLMPSKSRITLPGPNGLALAVNGRISFWIVSPGSTATNSPMSQELQLVRLDQKSDRRQLQTGATANGFAVGGVSSKHVIELRVAAKSETVVVVTPTQDLPTGEYALIAREANNAFRVYDFSIRLKHQ